jgi:opacity protein-like surface antigen
MKTLFIFIFLHLSVFIFAQSNSYMGILMGASIPMGDFASASLDNDQAGYATTSFNLTMDGAYLPSPYIGVGGAVSFSNNSLNTGDLKNNLKKIIQEDFPDADLPDDVYISYDLGVWNHVNLMIGPHASIPLDRLSIDFRVLGGMSFVFPPESQLYFATEDDEFRTYRDNKSTVSFGYMAGTGFRYTSRSNMMLRLMVDYSYTKTTIEITDYHFDIDMEEVVRRTEYTQPMGTIHVGVGIGYTF